MANKKGKKDNQNNNFDKKGKKNKKQDNFEKTLDNIKEYITNASKPYANYINKFDQNNELMVNFDQEIQKISNPINFPNKKNSKKGGLNQVVNIQLSLFTEIIIELVKDIIPDDEKEDIAIALDNLLLQINISNKSIILKSSNDNNEQE